MKQYLGDAVYAEIVDGRLTLTTETTENGYRVTNRIVLEIDIFAALAAFLRAEAERLHDDLCDTPPQPCGKVS
jgi:hypothetical protein